MRRSFRARALNFKENMQSARSYPFVQSFLQISAATGMPDERGFDVYVSCFLVTFRPELVISY